MFRIFKIEIYGTRHFDFVDFESLRISEITLSKVLLYFLYFPGRRSQRGFVVDGKMVGNRGQLTQIANHGNVATAERLSSIALGLGPPSNHHSALPVDRGQ